MKPAKLMMVGLAGFSALGAMYLYNMQKAPVLVQQAAPVENVAMTEVLVANAEIPIGMHVTTEQLRWQRWPKDAVSDLMITKASAPDAMNEVAGSIARGQTLLGEPVRRDKMIKGANGGFLSAVLPTGKRAVAINIVANGGRSAGGFILPNDRVDVMKTGRDEDATRARGADVLVAETLLRNIRVLAIGQNIQERNGEKVVVGETATLELDPKQSEVIALAQRTGEVSLVLRSLADANVVDEPVKSDDASLTIVRFGDSQTIGKK
jgi:pilus assembly protein CpaB